MMKRNRLRAATAGLVLLALLGACARVPGIYVYEADGSSPSDGSATAFDAKSYVEGIWASKIVPTVQDRAVDVSTVAAAIAADPEAAGERYGHRAGTGSPYAYLVKGTGQVTGIDTSVPTGPMTVEIPRTGGKPLTVTIATGPVIAGTALRDGVGFISFGDFTNQIAYAEVANRINDRAKTDVIAKAGLTGAEGRTVTFAGAFSALAPGSIFLVPTELRVTG